MAVVTPNTQIVAIIASRRAPRASGRSPMGATTSTSWPGSTIADPPAMVSASPTRPPGAVLGDCAGAGPEPPAVAGGEGSAAGPAEFGGPGSACGRASIVLPTLTIAAWICSVPGQSGTMRTRYSPFLNFTETAAPSPTAIGVPVPRSRVASAPVKLTRTTRVLFARFRPGGSGVDEQATGTSTPPVKLMEGPPAEVAASAPTGATPSTRPATTSPVASRPTE